jgi:hypothetical protein
LAIILTALLLVILLFGAGSALHALYLLAGIALIVWLVGWWVHPTSGRWYRW